MHTDFDPAVDELELLEMACRTADDVDRLTAAMGAVDELMVPGSTGQLRPHPLLRELRETRRQYADLLARLGLRDGAGEWDGLTAEQRARRAASKRWHR